MTVVCNLKISMEEEMFKLVVLPFFDLCRSQSCI